MFTREESGYGSAESATNIKAPEPNHLKIVADALRLESEFEVTDLLMNSANGVIYQGCDLKNGNQIIFKQLPRQNVQNWVDFEGSIVPSEIAYHFKTFQSSSDAENSICRPIAWLEKNSSFVLVLEKLGGENCVDLFELSKKYGAINEGAVKIIFGQILKIWETLNRAGVCHRDLKDENIIINPETLECRLIDFGCATKLSKESQTSFAGTPEFFPPEWFRTGKYRHESVNSWSIGVILFILLTGTMPSQISDSLIDFEISRDADYILEQLSPGAQNLLISLLEVSQEKRADLITAQLLYKMWS